MGLLTREQLLAAVELPREVVAVPELGGQVLVQGMSGAQRDAWEASLISGRGKRQRVSTENIRAKLVAQCCIREDGTRMFSDDDAETLGRARVDILNRLFNVAQRLSGVTDEDVDELGSSTSGGRSTSASRSN